MSKKKLRGSIMSAVACPTHGELINAGYQAESDCNVSLVAWKNKDGELMLTLHAPGVDMKQRVRKAHEGESEDALLRKAAGELVEALGRAYRNTQSTGDTFSEIPF